MSYNTYVGGQSDLNVNPSKVVPLIVRRHDPTIYNTQNFTIGWHWLNEDNGNLWYLSALAWNQSVGQFLATWILLSAGTGDVISLTSNTGGAVFPLAGNINIVGDGTTITGVGDPATNTITLSASGTGVVSSLTTQDGHVVTPAAGTIIITGSGNIATTGTVGPNTVTVGLTGITQYSVQVGGASNALTQIANGTTGQVLTANTGGNPTWTTIAEGGGTVTSITAGTGITLTPSPITTTGSVALTIPVVVSSGGTGDTSFTAYAPIVGGTTTTGALQSASTGISTSGYVLTSNGSSAIPSFQMVPSSGGGLVLIQTQTAVAATSLSFTTGITSTYNNYLLITQSLNAPLGSSAIPLIQLSTNGGSSYISTGYFNSGSFSGTTNAMTFGAAIGGATILQASSMSLYNLTSGANYIIGNSEFNNFTVGSAIGASVSQASAYGTTSTIVNAFQIIMSDGSAFNGTFSLYGYAK